MHGIVFWVTISTLRGAFADLREINRIKYWSGAFLSGIFMLRSAVNTFCNFYDAYFQSVLLYQLETLLLFDRFFVIISFVHKYLRWHYIMLMLFFYLVHIQFCWRSECLFCAPRHSYLQIVLQELVDWDATVFVQTHKSANQKINTFKFTDLFSNYSPKNCRMYHAILNQKLIL